MFSPCSELGILMYWTGNSMNNLLWYCGLLDAKIRASDIDLPVVVLGISVILFFVIIVDEVVLVVGFDLNNLNRFLNFCLLLQSKGWLPCGVATFCFWSAPKSKTFDVKMGESASWNILELVDEFLFIDCITLAARN